MIREDVMLPEFDADGLLARPEVWSEAMARQIARADGVGELTVAHWDVIRRLRADYTVAGKVLAVQLISLCDADEERRIRGLFRSYLEAWRVSGLPNPGKRFCGFLWLSTHHATGFH